MNSYRLEDDQLSLGSIDTPVHSPGPKSFHSALSPEGGTATALLIAACAKADRLPVHAGSQGGQDTPVGSATETAAATGVQPGAHSSKIRTAVQQLEGFRNVSAPGGPAASALAGALPAGSLAPAVPGALPSTPAATTGGKQQVADSPSSSQRPAHSHDGGLAVGGISGDGRRAAGPGAAAAEPSAPRAAAAATSAGAPATSQQSVHLAVSATPPSTPTHGGAQAGAGRQAASGASAGAAGGQHSPFASSSSQLGAGRQPAAAAQATGTGGAAGQSVSSLAGSRQLGAAPDQVDRPTVVKMAAIRDPGVGPVATAVAAAAALQADKEQAHQKTATAEATTAPGAEWQDPSAGAPSGRPGCMPA